MHEEDGESLNSDDVDGASEEIHNDPSHAAKVAMQFSSLLSKYQIETDLDRKLLLGVLVRDYHLKKKKESRQSLVDLSQTRALENSTDRIK